MNETEVLQSEGLLPFDGDTVRIKALERIRDKYNLDSVDLAMINHVLSL
jgi:hypothetical protein